MEKRIQKKTNNYFKQLKQDIVIEFGGKNKILDFLENYKQLIFIKEYFLKSFSSRLAEYTDPKIRVDSQKKLNDKYTMVSSTLLATDKKPEVKIEWRVYTKQSVNALIRD